MCLLVFAVSFANASAPEIKKPKWELGVGIAAQYVPDYRGSKRQRSLVLPFPMLRYSGRYIKADEDGVRSELRLGDRLRLDVSAESALVVGADDNVLRMGMPELLPAFQIGPSLIYDVSERWTLHLPVRTVAATNLRKAEYVGWVVNPYIQYKQASFWRGWEAQLRLGVLVADEDYNEYYYGVGSEFVRSNRGYYDAKAGYNGTSLTMSIRQRRGQLWTAASLRLDSLHGSVMHDSPLLESKANAGFFVAVGWFFK